jgi:phosphatidylinositol glycan class A protein
VVRALSHAIQVVQSGAHDPVKAHERVRGMYAWSDVAERTEKVYDAVLAMEHKDTFERLSQ